MVLQKLLLPLIKYQLKLLEKLHCTPISFDCKSQRLVVKDPPFTRWIRRILQILQWSYSSLMIIPVVRLWKSGCYGKSAEGFLSVAAGG